MVAKIKKTQIAKGQTSPVNAIDDNGRTAHRFMSIQEAEDKLGVNHANIIRCLNGKTIHAGGFRWERATTK